MTAATKPTGASTEILDRVPVNPTIESLCAQIDDVGRKAFALIEHIQTERDELREQVKRLRTIENAALRVASSRRNGIVTDQAALDRLDAALESRT